MSTVSYQELANTLSGIARSTKATLSVNGEVVGLVTGVTITQDPDVRRMYEIGSTKPKLATGIVPVRVTINKLMGFTNARVQTALQQLMGKDVVQASDGTITNPINISLRFEGAGGLTLTLQNCVLSSYSVFVNAGDTFVMENITFEAAKVSVGS